MNDRDFWLQMRRGLLTMVDAIERKFEVGKYEPRERSLETNERKRSA